LLQLGHVSRAPIGQRREVSFGDLEILEYHHAGDLVDLRARSGKDRTERFLLRSRRLDRERRTKVDLVAYPLVDLRLVDEHCGIRDADVARPRVRRNLRRGRSRRLRRLGKALFDWGKKERKDGDGRQGEEHQVLRHLATLLESPWSVPR